MLGVALVSVKRNSRRGEAEAGMSNFHTAVESALATLLKGCYVFLKLGVVNPGERMAQATDRRTSRRFTMALPLDIRHVEGDGSAEAPEQRSAKTQDVSFRGLYFIAEGGYKAGARLEFILTLPKEVTLAGDVHIRCFARIVRVDSKDGGLGVAARIERYEFLPGPM
jgi:hypothetical protein